MFRASIGAALLLPALGLAGIQDVVFHSELNRRDVAIKVYTPPGYEQSRECYPVVYNLHGGNGSPRIQWERTSATINDAMNNQRVRPMIYVFAEGLGNTLFLDYADGSLKVESMIMKELIPFIDEHYRTIASHEGRAIDGFSMGGYGALLIAFRYPQLFSSVVSYGAAMLSPEMIKINGENGHFPSQEFIDNNSPWALIEKNKDRIKEHLRVRMVCGEEDVKWYSGNVKLKARADALGLKVDWVPVAGVAHDTKGLYQRAGLESLRFIERGFDPKLDREEGLARDLFYYSPLNKRDVLIKVYTPPGYDKSATRYPVVYNLHGAGGGSAERQWSRSRKTLKDAIENGKVRPVIYVFADGLGDTFFVDYDDHSVMAESTIINELIPFIDGKYRTIAARDGRSIEGFSMGGAGALQLALKHPDLFAAVVSYGAAVIRPAEPGKENPRVPRAGSYRRNCVWTMAPANADRIRGKLAIRMVSGELDGADRPEGLFKLNGEFKELLKKLGIDVDWVPVPGVAHDTKGLYDRAGLDSLKFVTARFRR